MPQTPASTVATDQPKTLDECYRRIGELLRSVEDLRRQLAETEGSLEHIVARANRMVFESEVSQLLIDQVLNASHDSIWAISDDFRVLHVNDQLLELAGKARKEVLGKPCYEVLRFSCCQTALCPMKAVRQLKRGKELDASLGGIDSLRHFIIAALPFRGIDGEAVGIVEAIKDITDRKVAEDALLTANQSLERLAAVDPLTQLANRRRFDDVCTHELARKRREKNHLSIIMLDVDQFKLFNDHYGHPSGDACLKAVAQAIQSCVRRPADLVARYGGEEFVVVLPNTQSEGAAFVADNIRRAILKSQIPHEKSEVSDFVTASLGLATSSPDSDLSAEQLVAKADAALYQAKLRGRNRVIVADF